MARSRQIAAFAAAFLLCGSTVGCDVPPELLTELLMEAETSPPATLPTEPETLPTETEISETTAETAPPETVQTAETATAPPVPEPLLYATPKMLEVYDYFAAVGEGMPETFAAVDWSQVPYFADSVQLELYLRSEMAQCRTVIPVIGLRGCKITDTEEMLNEYSMLNTQLQQTTLTKDGYKLRFAVYTVEYSTGANCLQAYRTGDTSRLDAEDLAAYQEAQRFLTQELDTAASPLMQEKQIHDYICERTVYLDIPQSAGGRESFRMASGVLLDGAANCMGYADAFWMLASMAGFSVQKDTNEDHMWNLIELEDGLHLVDVTWDDDCVIFPDGTLTHTYRFFNAGMDTVLEDYTLEPDCATQGIVPSCTAHTIEEEYAGEWIEVIP